ncbi:hypothetical protein DFP74_6224 [Nocardiopsis sp. Huas11]|uniref:hypothetical protein n=1 Tax=Nocardiopsis sp. Huas11 TaxID=2183912 RepID=UPI000F0FD5EF|nr:hypothetical protein [Nocardiopsis sp. Huas11]RKS10457.1 hypothetical protein DFP74_6224 [Nocardiopsis sp. Huas11]
MSRRFRTQDGKHVGVGDAVWSQNHWPRTITGVVSEVGADWVVMDATEDAVATGSAIGADTLRIAAEDFSAYVYESHPPAEECERAGCRFRPWGARRS